MALALLCVVLLAGGTVFIIFSWKRLRGSDDAEFTGWFVMLGLGLSATAAYVADAVLFPKAKSSPQPLHFVILHHEGINEPHFDVMLETTLGSPLTTWRSDVWPIVRPTTLQQLANHRRQYLTYEGEISGGRGAVRRIAGGTYRITDQPDGAKLIHWNSTVADPSAGDCDPPPPLLLRRIEGNRWYAVIG